MIVRVYSHELLQLLDVVVRQVVMFLPVRVRLRGDARQIYSADILAHRHHHTPPREPCFCSRTTSKPSTSVTTANNKHSHIRKIKTCSNTHSFFLLKLEYVNLIHLQSTPQLQQQCTCFIFVPIVQNSIAEAIKIYINN